MDSYGWRASDSLRNVHPHSGRAVWNKRLGKLQLSKQLNIGSCRHRTKLGCDTLDTVFGIQEDVLGLVELDKLIFSAFCPDDFYSAQYPPVFNLHARSKLRFQILLFRKRSINVFVGFQIHQLDT